MVYDSLTKGMLDELFNSFAKCKQALKDGHYKTAADHSSMGLEDLKKIECMFLSIRSVAYQQQGEFNEALDDAIILQKQQPPYDIQGFLYAAQALYKQEKLTEAIETCNMILTCADYAPDNACYGQLAYLKSAAINKIEHRLDPVQKLPYDILNLILNELSFDDILNSLYVTRSWQKFIVHSSRTKSLQNLTIKITWMQPHSYFPYGVSGTIQLISDHIRNLDIEGINLKARAVLEKVSFHHLRSLVVTKNHDDVLIDKERILLLLKNASDSLEQVELIGDNLPSLNQVLTLCPNLKVLSYSHSSKPLEKFYGQHPLPVHLSLTHLGLLFSRIQSKEIEDIIKSVPNLKEFSLYGCESETVYALGRYGYHIQHIKINSSWDGPFKRCSKDTSTPHNNGLGMELSEPINTTVFKYHTVDASGWDESTAEFLLPLLTNKYAVEEYKLEALAVSAINFNEPYDTRFQYWQTFSVFHSQHLRALKIVFSNDIEWIFATVIRQCPALEEISIQGPSRPTAILFDAISALQALRCLGIDTEEGIDDGEGGTEFVVSTPENQRAMRSFFEHHVLLGGRSTLEQVRLCFFSGLETKTWEMLLRIRTLKSLYLMGWVLLDTYNVERILGNLMKSPPPLLDHLAVRILDSLQDHSIDRLDFTTVQLKDCYYITTQGVVDLCNHAKRLKKLEIIYCPRVEREPIAVLAKKKNIQFVWKKL